MPKSFLMSGKRKKLLEEIFNEEEEMADVSDASSTESSDDSGVPDSEMTVDTNFSSPEHDLVVSSASSIHSSSAFVAVAGRNAYPAIRPQPVTREVYWSQVPGNFPHGAGHTSAMALFPPPTFPVSLPPLPRVCAQEHSGDSPWTNVDTNIPFTNYLRNLSKVLNASSKQGRTTVTSDDGTSESDNESTSTSMSHMNPPTSPLVSHHAPSRTLTSPARAGGAISSFLSTQSVLRHQLTSQPLMTSQPIMTSYGKLYSKHPVSLSRGLHRDVGGLHPAFLQMGGGVPSRRSLPDKPAPVKKYKCDTCGKAFSRSNTLVTHKRIHTGDKPFKCEQCGRAFRQPGNLTRHRLTHTTFKPYVCPTCNKAFNRASNLHTHMRTHTSYKPFVCSHCGKGFHQKIDMKIHSYTHTGERPHRCDLCGKGFTLASTLNAHRRTHACDASYIERCSTNLLPTDLTNSVKTSHSVVAVPR